MAKEQNTPRVGMDQISRLEYWKFSTECEVDLQSLSGIASRCMIKELITEAVYFEEHGTPETGSDFQTDQIEHRKRKYGLCEMAGAEDLHLWILDPQFRDKSSVEGLTLLRACFGAVALAAHATHDVWSRQPGDRNCKRRSLLFLAKTQALLAAATASLNCDADYDQLLAYWWVRASCAAVGVPKLNMESLVPQFVDARQVEDLLEDICRFIGEVSPSGQDQPLADEPA